jgi:hypothetical protein
MLPMLFGSGCIVYLIIGVFQFFAVINGVQYITSLPTAICVFLSFILAYIPGIASILAIVGATKVWGWNMITAICSYFVLPVFVMAMTMWKNNSR